MANQKIEELSHQFSNLVKRLYHEEPVQLHVPWLDETEKNYLNKCLENGFVSTAGEASNKLEKKICDTVGVKFSCVTNSGTSALHLSLLVAGVTEKSEVITQPFSFIATSNAIKFSGAEPVFVDIEQKSLGMCPKALQDFVHHNYVRNGERQLYNKQTGRILSAIMPVHMFGNPLQIEKIIEIANELHLPVLEDAAEALGSRTHKKYCGSYGLANSISFNGNKIITTGAGGALLTDDEEIYAKALHLSTTAKVSKGPWATHDKIGFNYRMPSLNAALGLAQFEKFEKILQCKRNISKIYSQFFKNLDVKFLMPDEFGLSNCWLNTLIFDSIHEQKLFIEKMTKNGINVRPAWPNINLQKPYVDCFSGPLPVTNGLSEKIVNLPSSYTITL